MNAGTPGTCLAVGKENLKGFFVQFVTLFVNHSQKHGWSSRRETLMLQKSVLDTSKYLRHKENQASQAKALDSRGGRGKEKKDPQQK